MKKFSAVLAVVLVLMMTLTMAVSAAPDGIVENPPVDVPNSAPTVDGVINEDEGWSTSACLNNATCGHFWGHNPLTTDGNIRFAWSEEGLYYCANIVEGLAATNMDGTPAEGNSFIPSTGEDWIDVNTQNPADHYGYDGDIFGLIIDPLEAMLYGGFAQDFAPWYLIGLFEDGTAKMYRQKINSGDITDQVQIAGHQTEQGWQFEAMIPWEIIIKDISDITYGDVNITVEEILTNGSIIKAAALYQDRFMDEEAGETATWGRYITVPETQADGTPGYKGTGESVQALGITLNITDVKGPDPDPTPDPDPDPTDTTPSPDPTPGTTNPNADTTEAVETEEVIVDVTDEKGNVVTDASGNKVTQKVTQKVTTKKQNSGTTTGGSDNAQTLDVMLAVSIGALAVSGIGFAATKKRK